MFDDNATTNRTLRNIRKALERNLKEKYGIEDDKITEKILGIHGLNKKNFDFVNNIEIIINDKLNDVSIDSNSNKNEKTVEGIQQEAIASVKKAVGYDYLYRQMVELYGKDEAKRLSGEMYDLSLGLSDSTNVLKNYCYSFDFSKIVTIGRDFGQLKSSPAKRVDSYISALCETIHQLSSHIAGAVGVGSFFLDIGHLCLYKENYTIEDLKNNIIRKRLENEFQKFVHSVNHLSRNAVESPFSNLSFFDKIKMKNIIKEMSWYFPIMEEFSNNEEEFYNFVVEYISEIQNIFLDFFDKGDPLKGGVSFRFPVCTINISKEEENGSYVLKDEDFVNNICNREIFRYNIFVSKGTRAANCCRLLSNTEMHELASQSNSFGAGGSISLGSHRVCTINFMRIALEANTKEEFYNILSNRIESSSKILKAHKVLLKKMTEKGLQPFIKNGWMNMNRLFSTFGILGLYEASILFKEKFNDTTDIQGDILIFLNKKMEELNNKSEVINGVKFFYNAEQVPAESFAIRLVNADKYIYGEENIPYQLYSNQFIPLWEKATIWERMEIDGKYNALITGGGIVHINIGERTTSIQSKKIIEFAVKSGSEHFALNAVYSECENGHTTFGKSEICPICSGKIIEMYTRVVGFNTPVSSWQDVRRNWEFPKRSFDLMSELGF